MKKVDHSAVKSINALNDFTESLRTEINKKVNTKTLDKVVESMAVFCTYEDLKDLYQKTIPALD
jgi:prophage maintenance system killer protein